MKAMILAAGFGTRLFPLTIDRTKPAIPFLGKPLVGYVAEYISRFGIKDVVVNLHHQPESVIRSLGDGKDYGVNIHYTHETPSILGTAGALDNAKHLLKDETFIIVNGKIITDIDINAAIETHRKTNAIATMVLKPNTNLERFTEVIVSDGKITGFGDYPETTANKDNVPLMFTGIHILEPEVFDYIPKGVYSDIVPVFYRPAIENGKTIAAHITNDSWFELSTIPRYLEISLNMLDNGKIHYGTNCEISNESKITNSILWDNIKIGSGVNLNRTIIADGVSIPSGKSYSNAAIVKASMLNNSDEKPEKALSGYFDGENYIVNLDQ